MTASPDWTVGRPTRKCAATGRPLVEGEICHSVLREEDDRFVRQDYAEDAWPDVPRDGLFSYWKTRIPDADDAGPRRLAFDVDAFHEFFVNLAGDDAPRKRLFRGVLALMLVRKRALRLDGVERREGGDVLVLFDRRRDRREDVPVPDGPPEEIEAVERELAALLEA